MRCFKTNYVCCRGSWTPWTRSRYQKIILKRSLCPKLNFGGVAGEISMNFPYFSPTIVILENPSIEEFFKFHAKYELNCDLISQTQLVVGQVVHSEHVPGIHRPFWSALNSSPKLTFGDPEAQIIVKLVNFAPPPVTLENLAWDVFFKFYSKYVLKDVALLQPKSL